jgi:hypothetical protein
MIAATLRGFSADFLTVSDRLFRVEFPMRQSLRIRVEFVPSRLSTQHLRSAYELVAPVVRRTVEVSGAERAYERVDANRVPPSSRRRTSR